MLLLDYLLYSFSSVYLLWLFYLAIMNLKRAKDAGTMTPVALVLGYGIAVPGLLIDIAVNITVGTVLFLDVPRLSRLTLSARMSWYYEHDTGWRRSLSEWFARNLLNTYDPSGKHIK
jgi:hypothetical protein